MHPNWYQNMPDENKQKKNMESNTGKVIFEEDEQKIKKIHERILERMQKKRVQQCVEENKKNDVVKSVDVVTKFIKDEAETSIDDADVDFDDDVDDK